MGYVKNDIISITKRITSKQLTGFKTFIGKVKKIDEKGGVFLHSLQLNTNENDSSTWIFASSGVMYYSFFTPDVDDTVEFYFPSGDFGGARYINIYTYESEIPINELNKYLLYYKDYEIYIDTILGSINIKNDQSEITLKDSGTIEIKGNTNISITGNSNIELESGAGIIATEKSVLGETLQTELEKHKLLISNLQTALNSWVPVPLDGGASLKALLAGFLALPIPDYTNVLSQTTKNN